MIEVDLSFIPESLLKIKRELLPKAQDALKALQKKTCVGAEWTGWYDYPKERGFAEFEKINKYVKSIDVKYDLVVVVGIGGSYLGTRAAADALGTKTPIVYAGHNLASSSLKEALDLLDKKLPIVNVISKSGTTTEPAVAFRMILERLSKRFDAKELAKRVVVTTDQEKGALKELAKTHGFKTFSVPDDVGGRYSVLTAVGQLPLALAGVDVKAMLDGADSYFAALKKDDGASMVLEYAAARNAAYRASKTVEILALDNPRLNTLAEWWKQLYGESEGKSGKGIFPASVTYTTDLHSLGQIVQEGPRNLFQTFLSFKEDQVPLKLPKLSGNVDGLDYLAGTSVAKINAAAILATKMAHFDGGVPCLEILTKSLDERSLGELFAFFETACAISAALLGVNPFDQPGVEAYKKNLFALLGKPGFEGLAKQLKQRLEE